MTESSVPAAHGRRRGGAGTLIPVILLTLMAVLILLPIVFTFLYSFFPKSEITAYLKLRGNYDVNSAKYTAGILLGQALVVPMMAYALSRFEFKGRDALFFGILMLMVLPFQVTMVPSVITLRFLGILETPWAVILPMWFSPFYIFLLRQFMIGLPNELLEAGMMDGAGTFRCYAHVVLPVCRPVLGAAAALSFADCWNLVEQPLVYLANRSADQPLSVLFNQISTDNSGVAFAGAALYILPALFVYFFFQEDILLGVTLSELK
jgi:multiple sugar transport system permease protein